MRATAKVKLADPFEWFGKMVTEFELREPPTAQFLQLGEPITSVFSQNGTVYNVETPGLLEKYLTHCVVAPENGADAFLKLSLEDAREVKNSLLNFFVAADARRRARSSPS